MIILTRCKDFIVFIISIFSSRWFSYALDRWNVGLQIRTSLRWRHRSIQEHLLYNTPWNLTVTVISVIVTIPFVINIMTFITVLLIIVSNAKITITIRSKIGNIWYLSLIELCLISTYPLSSFFVFFTITRIIALKKFNGIIIIPFVHISLFVTLVLYRHLLFIFTTAISK